MITCYKPVQGWLSVCLVTVQSLVVCVSKNSRSCFLRLVFWCVLWLNNIYDSKSVWRVKQELNARNTLAQLLALYTDPAWEPQRTALCADRRTDDTSMPIADRTRAVLSREPRDAAVNFDGLHQRPFKCWNYTQAQYMGALKNFESLSTPMANFPEIFNGLLFPSILWMCYKIWSS